MEQFLLFFLDLTSFCLVLPIIDFISHSTDTLEPAGTNKVQSLANLINRLSFPCVLRSAI